MSAAAMESFDICGPLPTGTTLLEASAGTGKTWTIGALVTRYVAEGVARLDQMLVVTFGRAASQELRERVRAQLVEAEAALADPAAYVGGSSFLALLLDTDAATLALRHRRIRQALAGFDAATIATTHQFCSMVLGSLGVAGDTDSGARLVEDLDDLMTEVVDDLYLRAFAYADGPPEFSRATALAIARAAVGDSQARLEPAAADPTVGPGRRVAFAKKVREEMDRRKRRLGILSYDDLLSRLADALVEERSPARARMRQRWSIVLVDEFQDTDPVQWQVLDRAFSGHATMVLIGDPKQAIYAFRGGDVFAYLAAAGTATTRKTLAVNWRSDEPLLASLQVMLEGAALGDDAIVVRPVEAFHRATRLAGAPHPAPLRLRVVRRRELDSFPRATPKVGPVRTLVARDLACDIRALLDSGATYDGGPIRPRDIAVIAYKHAELAAAKAALHDVGVPAVIAGGGSVFTTPSAVDWLALLEALEQPHRTARVRTAAMTPFVGLGAAELDAGGDDLTDRIADRLRGWAEVFAMRGVAAVVEAATADGLAARLLSRVDGERALTDLRHLGEVLHEGALRERLGLVALLTWLRTQVQQARRSAGTERTRRLDSDAAAVQLVTIHASKGLEYPVVYLPSLADRWVADPDLPLYHDAEARCRNVGAGGEGWADAVARAKAEDSGEWLRLLYVAMTRAQSQVVCWWSPTSNSPQSPLHRLLVGRTPGQAEVPTSVPNPSDDDVVGILNVWRDAGGPSPELAVPVEPGPPVGPGEMVDLAVRTFTREIDTAWRRASYSSLSAAEATPVPAVGSEPEDPPKDDELLRPTADGPDVPVVEPPGEPVPSPMAGLPVGATFGSLVHAVLEHADPDAPERGGDLRAELLHHVHEQLVRWPLALEPTALADALVAVCQSPLGPLAAGTTLRAIPLTDRLRELEFELPLAGGDTRGADVDPVLLRDLAGLLRRHLPDGDPVRAYADRLEQPALGDQLLRGYLTGSVDVVLRVDGRYLVVDYKTNWLGPLRSGADDPVELTAHHYRPVALDAAMGHSDYPLQALLYSLVLHRFLRWRQPGYDPDRHLGGVLYLYLRGMCGPRTPLVDGRPCGVFSWRPPAVLVEELSALVDGAARPHLAAVR